MNVYYVEDVTRAEQIKFPFNDPTNYPIIFIMCNTHDVLYYMLQEMNNYINLSFEFMMNSVFSKNILFKLILTFLIHYILENITMGY